MRPFIFALIAAGALAVLGACAGRSGEAAMGSRVGREIALTFDDAPIPDSHYMSGADRTARIVAALKGAHVDGAMIFAIGNRVDTPGRARLEAYARAGLKIANHSNTHTNARELSADDYLADVAAADRVLKPLPGFAAFYRYPFLSYGETVEKRDALRAGIAAMGYREGYVTVDPWDWYMAGEVDAAIARGQSVDWDEARRMYVDTLVGQARFADGLARRVFGRPVRQVMLLHENDLAALFIADAVAALRADGWRIVSAERAFDDPIARITPDTLRLSGGQLIAIASTRGVEESALSSGLNTSAALDARLAHVLGPAAEPRASTP